MGSKEENDLEGSASKSTSLMKRLRHCLLKKRPNNLTVILISVTLSGVIFPLYVHWMLSTDVDMKYDISHTSHPKDVEHFTLTVRNTGTAVIPHKSAEFKMQFKSQITNITWLSKPVRGTADVQCMGNDGKPFFYSLVFGSLSPKGTLKFRIYSKYFLHTEPKLKHAGNYYGMGSCEAEGSFKNQLCDGNLASATFADNLTQIQCPK